jgi:Leucine-rich repeat (LRR) protein
VSYKAVPALLYICLSLSIAAQSSDDDRIKIGNRYLPYPDYRKSEIDRITSAHITVDPLEPECINNLNGIEQLRNLQTLVIESGHFSRIDFSPLGRLPRLTALSLKADDSSIDRFPDLSALYTLEKLEIANQDLKYLAGIERLPRLKRFDIMQSGAAIRDIAVLSNLKELTWLSLSCPGTVISFNDLRRLENLTNMYLDACRVVDLSGISALAKLEELYIGSCAAGNLYELTALKNLVWLGLEFVRGYDINAVGGLSGMSSLKTLLLSAYYDYDPPHIDARLLANCRSIYALGLFGFTIEYFDALNNLPRLERVNTSDSVFFPADNCVLRDEIEVQYSRLEQYGRLPDAKTIV